MSHERESRLMDWTQSQWARALQYYVACRGKEPEDTFDGLYDVMELWEMNVGVPPIDGDSTVLMPTRFGGYQRVRPRSTWVYRAWRNMMAKCVGLAP